MLDFIGIVRQITGIFFAVDKNGDVRQIQAGDKIYAGEKVVGDQFNHSSDYIIITTKNAQYDTKIMGSNEYVFHTQDVQTMLSVYDVPILLEENILDLQQVQQTSQEELIPLELEPDFSHVSTFVPPSSRENEPSHIYEDQSVFIHPTQNEQSTKEYVPLEDRFEVDPRVHIEQPHLNIDPYSSKSADDYIPNDVPTAHDDTISTYEDIANSTIQSSVLNNDDMGMDYNANPIVALKGATKTNNAFSLISEHGTLVLNINGSYTYTLDNEKDEIQALNNDEFLEEIFTYTIEDFNGDQDTATLTIRINANDNDLPTLDVEANSVHEAGLASGSLANGSHITNGTFTFSAIDGLEKVTVNGIDISSNTLSITPLGNQIEITSFDLSLGTASYTYTLLSNETHPLGNADLIDNIEIKVYDTDYDSDVTTQNLAISIVDDVPTAIDDPGLGAHEGGSSFGINLIHNMWGDDIEGADGARILNFTTADGQTANAGETITIATGSLSVNSAGDWVFNPIDTSYDHDNNDPNLANFSYTLIDGDGDTSIGHQNVMLFDSNSKINVNSQTVTESNLANGTNPDNALLSITHNLNIQNNGGILNQNPAIIDPINDVYFTATTLTQLSALNLNALNLPLSYALSNDNHTLKATTADQDIFTLVLNNPNDATGATQSYTFTLHNAIDHTISDPTFQEFNFSITVEDIDSTLASSNSESTTYINVVISDDAPTAVDDPAQTLEEGVEVVSGNVRNNDSFDSDTVLHDFTYTADDSTTQSKTFSDIDTSFTVSTPTGELIIQNNGDWSFTSLASYDHTLDPTLGSFAYTLVDADADISNRATQTITVTDTLPTVAVNNASLNESNLNDGTAPNNLLLSSTQTIDITKDHDDISDVTFSSISTLGLQHNGIDLVFTLSHNDHLLSATAGATTVFTATINNPNDASGSTQSYTFELLETLDHLSDGDLENIDFNIVIHDGDSSVDSSFTVSIHDDSSTAVDENILDIAEGDGAYSSDLLSNDTIGADAVLLHSITYTNTSGDTVNLIFDSSHTSYTVNTPISTESMGELTVNQDGSYSFTPNSSFDHDNPNNTSASFAYTLKDFDNDTSSALQTINLLDTEPTIGVIQGNVDEQDTRGVLSTTATGGLNITKAQDDISDVYFTNATITALEAQNLSNNGHVVTYTLDSAYHIIATANGTTLFEASITNPNDSTGINQSYSFTLYDAIDHGSGTTSKNISFDFEVADIDLTHTFGNFIIAVEDDTPTATSDLDTIDEGGLISENSTVSNNLFNDDIGADFTESPVTGIVTGLNTSIIAVGNIDSSLVGTYGSILLDSVGNYTYTLDNTNLTVQGISEGETLTEGFSYTITDYDGDTSTSTLTITIEGTDDGVWLNVLAQSVNESGLSSGSADDGTHIIHETFTLEALDTLDTIVIGGTTLTRLQLENSASAPIVIDTTEGNLIINGYAMNAAGIITVNYSYELKNALTHTADITDTITITITDTDDDTSTQSLNISIIDDSPTAVNGTNINLVENSGMHTGINLLINDIQGADTATVHQFVYTNTSDVSTTANAGDTVQTPTGELNINADGSWTFTPLASYDHDNASTLGNFTYTIIDGDGDISNIASQTITISDTNASLGVVSTQSVDEDDLINGSDGSEGLIITQDLNITKGADEITNVLFNDDIVTTLDALNLQSSGSALNYTLSVDKHSITADDGTNDIFTITLTNTDGNSSNAQHYTFELLQAIDHPNSGQDTIVLPFDFTVVDIDSQVSTGSFSVHVIDDVPTSSSENSLDVIEGDIALNGMVDLMANDTFGADRDITLSSFTFTNESGNVVNGSFSTAMDTIYGTLRVNTDGSWSYTSDSSSVHPLSNTIIDTFTYTITDQDGDTSSSAQNIVVDDGADPTIDNAQNNLIRVYEGDNTVTFNGVANYDQSDGGDAHETTSTLTHKLNFTQGTDSVGITSFTFASQTSATIPINGSQTITSATMGTLKVYYDGTWEYSPPLMYTHDDANGINNFQTTFTYIITDIDGDHANVTGSQTIQVDDTYATISSTTNASIQEDNLSNGTNPDSALLIQNGTITLDISHSKSSSYDLTFNSTQSDATLNHADLSSLGKDIEHEFLDDYHTLTLKDSSNTAILTATINNPTSITPTYTVRLFKPFDHETALLENGNIEFDFDIVLTDDDGDEQYSTFKISIIDDNPGDKTITIQEDVAITFYSNADAIGGAGGNTTISTDGTYGSALVNNDGTLTYTPNPNFSGNDSFEYTTTLDDGSTTINTVIVEVQPRTDTPVVTVDNTTIQTNEDVAVALGFNAPNILDNVDEGSGNDDNPERISVLTLSGIPNGATLLHSDGVTSWIEANGSDITIFLNDHTHIDAQVGDPSMSIAEYESMMILPPAHEHNNFTITSTVYAYEVDINDVPLAGVASTNVAKSVTVDVLAITDTPSLSIDAGVSKNYTIDEDSILDLSSDLQESFSDNDGSEAKSYTFSMLDGSDLPEGMSINLNGSTRVIGLNDPSQTISYSGDNPTLTITPPLYFSGDILDLKITLNTLDNDTDSVGASPIAQSASVTVNIYVNPQSDDGINLNNVTAQEDSSFTFLSTLSLNDSDSETITTVELLNLPTNWVLKDHNGVTITDYVLDVTAVGLANILNYTLTPPLNSSTDITLNLNITVEDTQTVNGNEVSDIHVYNQAQTITLTPLSETKGDQVSTQGDVSLLGINEDSGFSNIFDNLTISNADTNESTLINFSNLDIGTQFKYNDGSDDIIKTVSNSTTGVDIPLEYLDTLQFKPASQVSGSLSISMKIKTTDYDDDNQAILSPQEISDADVLALDIAPQVDSLSIAPTNTYGILNETLTLNLNAIVEDSSETITLLLSNFSSDHLTFSNTTATVSYASGTYTLTNIPNNELETLQFSSSETINNTISITAHTVESDNTQSADVTADFTLEIITDTPQASTADDLLLYDGAVLDALDGNDTIILKQDISINFDAVSNLSNIEQIDLSQNGDHALSNIAWNDVMNITDSNNQLIIFRDEGDSVNLVSLSAATTWTDEGTEVIDGKDFSVYRNNYVTPDGQGDLVVKVEDII